ncbi:MAG: hypothetical protein LBU78_07475 [Microbacterium sp.]|jgi:hypothetical protein|nr:hypothetical protein [Microbacterium sp.]
MTAVALGLAVALGPIALLAGASAAQASPADDAGPRSVTALIPADTAVSAAIAALVPDGCTDAGLPITVEESRLTAVLPDAADPTRPADRTFARTMVEGGGFGGWTSSFADRLCRTKSLAQATAAAEKLGTQLWRDAVARAQSKGAVTGDLPASDDRPLYWTRIEAMAVLHQWDAAFGLDTDQRTALVEAFDKASRGMKDISFPQGKGVKRVLVSGFDPYTLDGGTTGPAAGTVGNNIRHGNPSGATALSIDGTKHVGADGTVVFFQAYTLPVNYPEFERGYLEDTVGPLMKAGKGGLDASVTVSQAGGSQFNLEQWNGRYHGVTVGNDRYAPCPTVDGVPQLAVDNIGCNTQVVQRWGGGDSLTDPPQWTSATLPMAQMIAAKTGSDIPRPPGDTWPDESVAFGVVWNTDYSYFADCSSPAVTNVSQRETTYPPSVAPTPPPADSCSRNGAGGAYLSNESAYRNTLLRDRLGLDIPAGHIHTPGMQNFESDFGVSDATFDAWRTAIAAQTRQLIHVVGENS